MARLPTNRDARKVAYLENCLARPPLALSFPTRSSSFGLPRIGVRRVYSFFPRTSSLFLQKSAKKCKKLQKSAKNGPFSAKSAQKRPSRRPNRGKTRSKLPETQQKAPKTPLSHAREHTQSSATGKGDFRKRATNSTTPSENSGTEDQLVEESVFCRGRRNPNGGR